MCRLRVELVGWRRRWPQGEEEEALVVTTVRRKGRIYLSNHTGGTPWAPQGQPGLLVLPGDTIILEECILEIIIIL